MSRKEKRDTVEHLLSSDTRVEILMRLWGSDGAEQDSLTPREYAAETGKPMSSVVYHFRVLHDAKALTLADTVANGSTIERRYRFNRAAASKLVEALKDIG